MSLHAGGVAFFAFLSAFPALLGVISAYGLFFDKSDVSTQLGTMRAIWPEASVAVFETELAVLMERSSVELSFGVAVGLIAAIWSARKGASALLSALDQAYDVETRRPKFRQLGLELLLTVAGVGLATATLALVAVVPVVARAFPPVGIWEPLLVLVPGLLAVVATVLGVAGLYWVGPNRKRPPFRWILPAALISVTAMGLVSGLFSIAVREFMSLEKTYGSLAAIAATLTLFYACSWVALLGAELAGAIEAELGRISAPSRTVSADARSQASGERPIARATVSKLA